MQKEADSECMGLEVPASFTANVWEVGHPITYQTNCTMMWVAHA